MFYTSVPLCLLFFFSLRHLSPPLPCLCLAFCLLLFHFVIFVILVSLTVGTEMVLEAQQTWGGYSPVVHVKAAVFPISPRLPVFLIPVSVSVLAFCYTHSTTATMSSSPASPLASVAHLTEGFLGLP